MGYQPETAEEEAKQAEGGGAKDHNEHAADDDPGQQLGLAEHT